MKCSTKRNCGRGFERMRRWYGVGETNVSACRSNQTAPDYQAACLAYCRQNPDCVRCTTARNCGVGYERINRWYGHDGRNWSACRIKERMEGNLAACQAYCREHPDCVKCSTKRNCGRGFERMERWYGIGETNVSACRVK